MKFREGGRRAGDVLHTVEVEIRPLDKGKEGPYPRGILEEVIARLRPHHPGNGDAATKREHLKFDLERDPPYIRISAKVPQDVSMAGGVLDDEIVVPVPGLDRVGDARSVNLEPGEHATEGGTVWSLAVHRSPTRRTESGDQASAWSPGAARTSLLSVPAGKPEQR